MRTLLATLMLATLAPAGFAEARRAPQPHVHCVLECQNGSCKRVCRPVKLAAWRAPGLRGTTALTP